MISKLILYFLIILLQLGCDKDVLECRDEIFLGLKILSPIPQAAREETLKSKICTTMMLNTLLR